MASCIEITACKAGCMCGMLQMTKAKGPTLPQPFHLTAERKRKLSEGDLPCSKFESMAEKVIKFSSKTPERFRRRPSPVGGMYLHCHTALWKLFKPLQRQYVLPASVHASNSIHLRPCVSKSVRAFMI